MYSSKCPECGAELAANGDLNATLGTPHHKLLDTNDPPEASDVAFIHSVASKTGARLASLEQEMSRLRARLMQLEAEHTTLSRYRSLNKSILSPVRRMPPELLSEIFAWSLPSIRDASDQGRFKIADSPWVLTHISHRWRVISLSTPSLWSLVAIDFQQHHPSTPYRASAYPLPMLEAQLQRAQVLKVHFYAFDNNHSGPRMEIFELLAKHSLRWVELSIGVTQAMIPLFTALRHRVPLLHRLWIQWDDRIYSSSMEAIDCFRTAPSLVDVSIYERYNSVTVPLPLDQLIRYELDGSLHMHLHCLKLATNLVEARIYVDPDDLEAPPHGTVELLSLRRLYVSDPAFLDHIRTPALEEIALLIMIPDTLVTQLSSLCARSSCTIRRLLLRGSQNAQITMQILDKMPTIIELGMVTTSQAGADEVSVLMSLLTGPAFDTTPVALHAKYAHETLISTARGLPPGTPIAPQLCGLLFGCDNTSSIDYTRYLEMVTSRWKSPDYSLQTAALLIDSEREPDPTILDGLYKLREDGLDFTFLTATSALEAMGNWIYMSTWN